MDESARINVKSENPQEKIKEIKKDLEGDYSNELYGILGIFYDKFRKLRSFHERYNYEEKVTVEHELEARIVLAEAAVKEINEIIAKMRKIALIGMQRDEVASNKDGKKIDLEESRIFLKPEEKEEWKNLKASLFSEENGVVLKFYKAVNKNDELNSRKSSRDASAFKTAFDFAEREKIHEI